MPWCALYRLCEVCGIGSFLPPLCDSRDQTEAARLTWPAPLALGHLASPRFLKFVHECS